MKQFLTAVILFLAFLAPAMAQDTTITINYGELLQQWSDAILKGALALLTIVWAWLGRAIPSQIFAIMVSLRAEQFLQKAIEYGINSVRDASKDKKLTVNVGNEVLAKALQFVIDNVPDWIIKWMGGPDAIAEKIWARLELDEGANDLNVKQIATVVVEENK